MFWRESMPLNQAHQNENRRTKVKPTKKKNIWMKTKQKNNIFHNPIEMDKYHLPRLQSTEDDIDDCDIGDA